jgi:hypothetical protein
MDWVRNEKIFFQVCGSGSAWIAIILGSRIRIRIRVKTGSEPDLHSSQTSGAAIMAKIEPWRALDAHNGGVKAQNGSVEALWIRGRRFASL